MERWLRLYLEDEEGVEIEAVRELEADDLDDAERREALLRAIKHAIQAHLGE